MGNARKIHLDGLVFGNWTVIKQSGNNSRGGALWLCSCSCGSTGTVAGTDLRSGKSKSCGCVSRLSIGEASRTHGKSRTRLYFTWKNMRCRCYKKNSASYANYGARGISVCREWSSFENFQTWAESSGYSDDLTIERIDCDKDYCPENCTWATRQVQNVNRRFVKKDENGLAWSEIAKSNGIPVTLMHGRLNDGWPIELAATKPKRIRM